MATPESKMKDKVKRKLTRLANSAGLPLFFDTPPASEYGVGGRPDHDVAIGTLQFHIEVKATKRKATAKQQDWHANRAKIGKRTLVVAGQGDVDNLYGTVRDMIIEHYSSAYLHRVVEDTKMIITAANALDKEPVRKQQSLDIAAASVKRPA